MSAFELFVVPLRDFGVRKQSVVAAGEASLQTLRDIVVKREVSSEGIVRVLPVAILRLVDRLKFVSSDTLNGKFRILFNGVCLSYTPFSKGILTNHSSTK